METPQLELRQIHGLTIPSPSEDGTAVIEGRAVPYGTTIDLGGIQETFAAGAADPVALRGKPILWQHNTSEVIGVVEGARNEDDGLYFRAKLLPTARGLDAQIALRAGAVSGLSIGFMPVADKWNGTHVTRTRVDIAEVSVATIPAYPNAGVTSIRTQEEGAPTVETTTPEVPAVDLSNLATREDLTALESRLQAAHTTTPQPILSVRDAFVAQLADATQNRNRQVRALDDVLSSGNAGILPPQWSSEVRNYVDRQRYAFGLVGQIGFPSAGYTLTIPKITQHTEVAARGTEKTAIPTRALETSSDTYTAEWYAGGVDIALELLWQSDPSVLTLVVESILSQYASVTDQALTLDIETSGTPTTEVLDFTGWDDLSEQLIANAEIIRAATGEWGDRLMLTTASWQSLVAMVDADGRRLFAPNGQVNADGSAPLLSRAINIGGILAVHNPRSVEDVQFNTKAARVGEKPPMTISTDNVNLMGRDIGVLGAYIWVPAYPAGILTYALS